jgi:Zn ribbon nucleic-acid-binding protein
MIEQGDGKFADRLKLGQCPRCQVKMKMHKWTVARVVWLCIACGMKVVDIQEKDYKYD